MRENISITPEEEVFNEGAQNESSRGQALIDTINLLKTKFPSVERTIHTVGGYIKIFSIIAIMGSSLEAGAQKVSDVTSDLEKTRTSLEIQNMSLDQIMDELNKYKLHFPEGQTVAVSYRVEEKNKKTLTKEKVGALSKNEGEIGDLGVLSSNRFVTRSIQTIDGKFDEKLEFLSYSSIDITSPINNNLIEGTGDTLKAIGYGDTKEDAMIQAIEALSKEWKVHVLSISEESTKSTGVNLDRKRTTANALNALNYLKNVRIISIEKIESAGQIHFEVKVEAEKGKMVSSNPENKF